MNTAILLATLLIVGASAVAVAPTASAGPVCAAIEDPPQACALGDAAAEYVLCYYHTAPASWTTQCL